MKVVVNADDFGYSQKVNLAISQAFRQKLISQTSILVNSEGFNDALALSENGKFKEYVGLHLNLTEGKPLTDIMSNYKKFTDRNGLFNGSLISESLNRFLLTPSDIKCIKIEVAAQIKKYKDSGFKLMHIDSHHHVHTNPSLIFTISHLAKINGFKSMRISRNIMESDESKLKSLYKNIVNRYINVNFKTTDFFSEYYYFDKRNWTNGLFEIMVHPDIINGDIVDVLRKEECFVKMETYNYRTSELINYNHISNI